MITVNLTGLNNQQFYTLALRVFELTSAVDTEKAGIKLYANNFIDKFNAYKNGFEKQDVSAKSIAQKDAVRDNYYIALRSHVRNFQYHPDIEMRTKASNILKVLNKQGNQIYAVSYKSETAALLAIMAEIDENFIDDINQLSANMWYNLLKDAQASFEQSVQGVTSQKVESSKIASATETRKDVEDALRKLFMIVPLQYEMTKLPELSDLSGQLQATADRF